MEEKRSPALQGNLILLWWRVSTEGERVSSLSRPEMLEISSRKYCIWDSPHD
jgi:hypothetical protein